MLYFQISHLENRLSVQCGGPRGKKNKKTKPVFIWKGKTIKRSRKTGVVGGGWRDRLKRMMFDMDYVELEALAGEIARWKNLWSS